MVKVTVAAKDGTVVLEAMRADMEALLLGATLSDWELRLAPVGILTRGRAGTALLGWASDHVLGRDDDERPCTCVFAIIEPGTEYEQYREAWPTMPFLILPREGAGAGYARYMTQQIFTAGRFTYKGEERSLRVPMLWLCDDNVSGMVEIARVGEERKRLQCPFWHACMAVQRERRTRAFAVAGFLRDVGHACTKVHESVLDSISVYKLVLLDLERLSNRRVRYESRLKCYEDMFLAWQCMKQGLGVLKMQRFAYRASFSRSGGAADERIGSVSGAQRIRACFDGPLPQEMSLFLARVQRAEEIALTKLRGG